MPNKPIFVTQPSLAKLRTYTSILESVWESGILTHNGPIVQKLEMDLSKKIGIKNFVAVTNGTVALQMAIKALDLKGEIITTPFTWIATISAIKWERCTPVFVDIDKDTLNIDPNKIEAAITEDTVAIMPVHVFGVPCNVGAIEKIAKKYSLKVIYDAAHAIGSTYNGNSLLEYGDISATSMHATKLFNTGEGGGCITRSKVLYEKLKRIRFFGHDDAKDIVEDGFNGKLTEIHAALGLANLEIYDQVLKDREQKYHLYLNLLGNDPGLTFQKIGQGNANYSYFPVIFENEDALLAVVERLKKENVYARRYFYPAVNTYNKIVPYRSCPIAEDISNRILCLPLYLDLKSDQIELITERVLGK